MNAWRQNIGKEKVKMDNIVALLGQLNFMHALWLFYFFFVIHELEEWNINQFEHQNFVDLPPSTTDKSARLWIGCVCLVGLIWTTIATLPGHPGIAACLTFPVIAIVLENSVQHIYWSIYFKQFAPGIFTSVLLLIPFGCYVMISAVNQGYVELWYVLIWAFVITIGFIQTVMAGNKLPSLVRTVNRIGVILAKKWDNLQHE